MHDVKTALSASLLLQREGEVKESDRWWESVIDYDGEDMIKR